MQGGKIILKIKDDVNLKELEKFGFKKSRYVGGHFEKEVEKTGTYWISEKTRIIEFGAESIEDLVIDSTLYDLIQAGLVEKAEV